MSSIVPHHGEGYKIGAPSTGSLLLQHTICVR